MSQETAGAGPSLFVATTCYGGQADAAYLQSLLALRAVCAQRRIGLHVELGGGEALIGRARAAMMAKFLASPATHLLFIESDAGFDPDEALRLLATSAEVIEPPAETERPARLLLISRSAAQRTSQAYPDLHAKLGDTYAVGVASAAMVFDSFTDPETGHYLTEKEAFTERWRAITAGALGSLGSTNV